MGGDGTTSGFPVFQVCPKCVYLRRTTKIHQSEQANKKHDTTRSLSPTVQYRQFNKACRGCVEWKTSVSSDVPKLLWCLKLVSQTMKTPSNYVNKDSN